MILYIKNDVKYEILNVSYQEKTNISAIYSNDLKTNVINIYKAPKNNSLFMENAIIGDINLDTFNDSNNIKSYKRVLQLNNYKIQNTHETRRNKNKDTFIDHIITPVDKKCTIRTYDSAISDPKILNIKILLKNNDF
ncbi:hypothetical protein WA026_021766 [Henosepilachna vigintioctopunctata]|uniref:Uncharacterized protein n=1 Tax=Henosepilachna vigintioctopunctata TaxID=420089 RepID=A0AAW1TY40_9CUCU